MNISTLFSNNNLTDYGILISCGLILGCSLFYLIKSNNTAIPSTNIEGITNEEIDTIINESEVTKISNANIDAIIDSDSDTESYISSYDTESTLDVDLRELDLLVMPYVSSVFSNEEFIMPDVDFNICPIEELKLFELCSIFSKEMIEHELTEEDMKELIAIFPESDLATN
jgi:hypothetical protein